MDVFKIYFWLDVLLGPLFFAMIALFCVGRLFAIHIARRVMTQHAVGAGYPPEIIARNNRDQADAFAHDVVSASFCMLGTVCVIMVLAFTFYAESAENGLYMTFAQIVCVIAMLCISRLMLHTACSAYEHWHDFVLTVGQSSQQFSQK